MAETNIVDGSGARFSRFRISDCPNCRTWPLNLAASCACCEGKSTAIALPEFEGLRMAEALVAAEERGRIAEREAASKIVKVTFARFGQFEEQSRRIAKMALGIAERAVRRGRHLTAQEQLGNLANALAEDISTEGQP